MSGLDRCVAIISLLIFLVFILWAVIKIFANIEICKTYFTEVSLISCMISDRTVVRPVK
jgi:hypothetical protein